MGLKSKTEARSFDEDLGSSVRSLAVPTSAGSADDEPVTLGDFKPVSSYNWIEDEPSSILVPGELCESCTIACARDLARCPAIFGPT